MKLYDLDLSGNCYKIRLFASFINAPLTVVPVNLVDREHKESKFLDLNPWGEIPLLEDDGITIRDSQAILVYLANKYGGEAWWPSEAHLQAEVVQWLSVAANEIQHGPNTARLIKKFGVESDLSLCLTRSAHILKLINSHLASHDWLAIGRPTIADCAVYPYLSIAHEGGIEMDGYTHISVWMNRIEQLPGYISM